MLKRNFFAIGLYFLFIVSTYAQEKILVTSKPFIINSSSRSYEHLSTRLPELICNGILYPSELSFHSLGITRQAELKKLTSQTLEKDSAYGIAKPVFNEYNIKFMLEGEMHVVNDLFFVNIYGTDFKQALIPYQSKIQPISQIQHVIDEACENINYQILSRLSGQSHAHVLVSRFRFLETRKNDVNLYEDDFPAKYLAYNLGGSKFFDVLPYESNRNQISNATLPVKKADVILSGSVDIDGKGNCTIQPELYWPTDTLSLLDSKGTLRDKDKLLERTLGNVKSMLEVIMSEGGLDKFNSTIAKYSDSEMRTAFESALQNNKPTLANYFAEKLSRKGQNRKLLSLYKSQIYYRMGDYSTALSQANEFLKEDSTSSPGNYFAALANIKLFRYENAKSNLKHISQPYREFKDVYFQRGVCLFYQDSIHTAIKELMKQKKFDEKANPELNAYIGLCYQWLAMWTEAEKYFVKQYEADSMDINNQNYLLNFYTKYAIWAARKKEYTTAYTYHLKSYQKLKRYQSLFGAIEASLKLKLPDNSVESLINMGIRDSVFIASSIYMELANTCRSQVDSVKNYIPYYLQKAVTFLKKHLQSNETSGAYSVLGSTYFRLNKFDSAEHFYSLALVKNANEPVHYFNLAELQTIMLKPGSALTTLEKANKKFILSTDYPYEKDYLKALYLIYSIENKIINGTTYETEEKAISKLLEDYRKGSVLFSSWSFRTFYNWIIAEPNLAADKKTKMLAYLCLVKNHARDVGMNCKTDSVTGK